MKKKLFAIFMTLILILGLAACGGGENVEPTKAPEPTKTETAKEPTKAPEADKAATTAPTEAPAADEAVEPAATTAPTATPTPEPTATPTLEPTPTPVPVVDRKVYDMTDWKFYLGTIEQAGNFNGNSIVFARNKNLYYAGFAFINADGTIGGYFFGTTGVDENTDIYSITEETTGEVAYFKMSGGADYYEFDLGGLGMVTALKQEENVAQQHVDLVGKVTTNSTPEFLIELAKVKEGLVEDGYYYGVMDTGELVYYARTENDTYRGLLITSENREDIVVVWGYTYYDETTGVEYIYDSTGYTLFYQITPLDGGYELKFANGALGTVIVTGCGEMEFMDAMDYAYKESINNRLEEFVNGLDQ